MSQGLPWGKEPRAQRQSSPLCPTLGCAVPWAPQTSTDAGSLGSCLLPAGPGRPELGRHWDQEGTAPKVQSCPLLPAAHCCPLPTAHTGEGVGTGLLLGNCALWWQRWEDAGPADKGRTPSLLQLPESSALPSLTGGWHWALPGAGGGGRRVGRHHPVPEGSQTDFPRREVTFHSSRRSGSPPSHSSPSKLAPSAHR